MRESPPWNLISEHLFMYQTPTCNRSHAQFVSVNELISQVGALIRGQLYIDDFFYFATFHTDLDLTNSRVTKTRRADCECLFKCIEVNIQISIFERKIFVSSKRISLKLLFLREIIIYIALLKLYILGNKI